MEAGYDVKMSEIHGMSQRGGSVSSQVRYSDDNVYSPVIEIGGADMIVSFEKMEALRYLKYLKPEGKGSVSSQVRYSDDNVYSPVIEIGGADMIVSFEKMEALRYLKYLKPEGKVVVNNYRLNSVSTLVGKFEYKEEEIDLELKRLNAKIIDAAKKAEELGNAKVMNVILLGSLVKSMKLEKIDWEDIIKKL